MSIEIYQVRDSLNKLASASTKPRFYKTGKGEYAEHDQFIGVTVPNLRKISKQFSQMSFNELQILLDSKINEERLLALVILVYQYPYNKDEAYQFYLNNLNNVNNWNLVDASAHLIIGVHLLDKDKSILFKLANSQIMWERRIAIVATWHFIKNHQYTTTIELAELLLGDNHDLIHKATGWMLREVGKKDESCLLEFLEKFSKKMHRTTLRYATERLKKMDKATF